MKHQKIQNKNQKGFTLIELIVVMAVFLLIIGVALTIFISIVQNQKRILAEEQLLNQASYAEEYMSKALRMATQDSSGTLCFDSASYAGYNYLFTHQNLTTGLYEGVKFINATDGNACEEFYLDRSGSVPVLKQVKGTDDLALTSSALIIHSIAFAINGVTGQGSINGAPGGNGVQPRMTITLGIQVPNDQTQPIRYVQTTVSQRDLNVPQ